ncbi:hypothetical protein [Mycobacterium sp. 1245111.1]|uniref:hypothetical protein n=1 Tax=Mycobacterium sp. 1245111.1 TaxID=1834073 RepID=UPI0009F66720|nr:hypothetical protein [Mycobacterium sp. 1245111.1]
MSTTVQTTVYLNQGDGDHFFVGYTEGDPLARAATFDLDTQLVAQLTGGIPKQALALVFDQLNMPTPTTPWAIDYRQRSNRSLSIGDVVTIGEIAFGLSRREGWQRVSIEAEQVA